MLATLKQRYLPQLDKLAGELHFRVAIAVVLVAFNIFAFAKAGHERLEQPFKASPDAPHYSDPDAPSVAVRGPRQPHHWSRLVVSRWDAQHYIGFAIRGITACPTDPDQATDLQYTDCGVAWFPGYGLAAGEVTDIVDVPADYVLVVMSCLAALVLNLLWTSKTLTDRLGRGAAYAALFAFNLYPTAFLVVTPYPEAAIAALTLGGFLCVAKDRWVWAGVLVGAATALSPSAVGIGFGLVAAALAAAATRHQEKVARWWRPLCAIPLAIWGVALTFLAYRIFLGDAWVYFRAQHPFTAGMPDLGLKPLVEPSFWIKGFTSQNLPMLGIAGGLAAVAMCGKELGKRFGRDELMFLAVSCAIVLVRELAVIAARGGGYWQLGPLVLGCPIFFLALGLVARRHLAVYVFWLAISLGLYWHVELCGYIAQGDPRICPCEGHLEAWMPYES
ncbi:MAG: hypothetical protein ACM31C_00050 [Acidobacteriota bacterium]